LYSLRLNEEDVNKVKEIAKVKWIPYQTLISSIIHQYVS
jgi:predicted DNA binding CopG/RHH family protein